MADYQLTKDAKVIIRNADSASIPNDPDNRDFQDYQAWVAAGNTADPYVAPPAPPAPPNPRQVLLDTLGITPGQLAKLIALANGP
jgi:hypothetical protein